MSEFNKSGWFQRFKYSTGRFGKRFPVLALVLVFLSGIVFLVGFNTTLEASNTLEFCVSCHEMGDNVFKEYQESVHYSNRTGVRAICADCHVPKDWLPKMKRKIGAAKDVYGTIMGVIDTPEKFEAKRHEMAVNVWGRMKADDSAACRNCHNAEAMSVDEQSKRAWRRHQKGIKEGMTCIDCHFGLVHDEPEGPGPQDLDFSG